MKLVYVAEGLKGFTIKIAQKDDSSRVIEMLKQIALWMRDHNINQWGFLLEGGDDEEIKEAISNQYTYIVLKDHDTVATFTLLPNQSEWDRHIWGEDLTSNAFYLHRLAVIPNYMNTGLGRSILEWIQHNCSEKEYIRLDCVADNEKLNNFYKNNYFELVGFEDGHSKYQKSLKMKEV